MALHNYDLIDDELWVGNIISKQKLFLWKILPTSLGQVQSKGPLTDQYSAKSSIHRNLQLWFEF